MTRREPETPWPQQFDNRPHPCKEGDVFKSQEGIAVYRTPRVKGVTPVKPIVIKSRIFVSSSRKRKSESSTKSSMEEEKFAKICQKAKFFPFREWSVSKKDFLETSGQHY